MMTEERMADTCCEAEEGAGAYEPPIMDVCARAAVGALHAVGDRLSEGGRVDERTVRALDKHWDALMLAGAESCERRSFTPPAICNRWLARLSAAEREELGFDCAQAEPFFELYAALLSRMWGWVTRRRMLAEMRAEQAARPPERLRWEDAEPIVRDALGATYQPPDTPEKREALRRWAEQVKRRGGTPTKALRKWLEAWRCDPGRRAELVKKALAWK